MNLLKATSRLYLNFTSLSLFDNPFSKSSCNLSYAQKIINLNKANIVSITSNPIIINPEYFDIYNENEDVPEILI
jgi:hypothetical protein